MAFDGNDFKGPGGVNVAECLRVADAIERSPSFDMYSYVHECGTPACIAGHTLTNEEAAREGAEGDVDVEGIAMMRLGINGTKASQLFAPDVRGVARYRSSTWGRAYITNAHAAACLRKLAATGEVDWLGTKPARPTCDGEAS